MGKVIQRMWRRSFFAALIVCLLLLLVAQGVFANSETGVPSSSDPTPHPILSDVRVRQAIAYCTDKDALIASVYPDLTPAERQSLIMDAFIAPFHWAYTPPNTKYDYNPALGRALLDQAGWILLAGEEYRRDQNGQLTISLTTTNSGFRLTFLTVFQNQMKACGIRLVLKPVSATWFYGNSTGLAKRDFELADFAWVGGEEPGGATLYACDQIPLPANNWGGQNYMGWCNSTASEAIKRAANETLPRNERKGYYATVIEEMAKDVPSLPLFLRWPIEQSSYTWEHIDLNLQTFSEWVVVQPSSEIGGSFTDFDGDSTGMTWFSDATEQATRITYTPLLDGPVASPGPHALKAFRIGASVDGVPAPDYILTTPMTITVSYKDMWVEAYKLRESSLRLYTVQDGIWQDASSSCPEEARYQSVDTATNQLTATICRLGEFTVRGTWRNRLFLPLTMR